MEWLIISELSGTGQKKRNVEKIFLLKIMTIMSN